ncbi:unnamed protein product [Durusdinium trenchii]|uniref:Uncharacterized protein n=1 Tax=Durusdinium trenchii TaxID=1381693 RepID=A0ABP0Q998_9DINO
MPTLSEQKRRRREQLSREQASMQRWWEKAPTMPGEACTAAQRRLAEKEHYTGACRLLQSSSLSRIGLDAGDYCISPPLQATRLLASRSHEELTIPKRGADFRAETEWRLHLRPASPSGLGTALPPISAAPRVARRGAAMAVTHGGPWRKQGM